MRGGYGKSGLAKHKVSYMLKYMPDHFGKHGFKSLRKPLRTINVGDIEFLVKKKLGETSQGVVSLDLREVGYDKLLGKGEVGMPVKILVDRASKGAVEKVEAAGGEVITGKAS
jgi:large subunit ribosomal protein L15